MTDFSKLPDCPIDLGIRYGKCKPKEVTHSIVVNLIPTRYKLVSLYLLKLTFWVGRFMGSYEESKLGLDKE